MAVARNLQIRRHLNVLRDQDLVVRQVQDVEGYGISMPVRRPKRENSMKLLAYGDSSAVEMRILDLKSKFRFVDSMAATTALVGLIISFIENEIFTKHDYEPMAINQVLRGFITITTGILIALVAHHNRLEYQLALQKKLIEGMEFKQTKYFKIMCAEIFINFIHCPPFLDTTFTVTQLGVTYSMSLDGIFNAWMLLRVYHVLRLFAVFSKWTDVFSHRACDHYGSEANTLFAVKAELKERPHFILTILLIASIIFFGLATRIFEYPLNKALKQQDDEINLLRQTDGNPDNNNLDELDRSQDFDNTWNSMWLIVLTMTTVGYGDFYPQSHAGRFVGVLACFWGIFLVSMMVVTMTTWTEFSNHERRAFNILHRLQYREDAKYHAAFIITGFFYKVSARKMFERGRITGETMHMRTFQGDDLIQQHLQDFNDIRKGLLKHDYSAEEVMRQLTEKVDMDLQLINFEIQCINKIQRLAQQTQHRQEDNYELVRLASNQTKSIIQLMKKNRINITREAEKIYKKVKYSDTGFQPAPRKPS
mmetsp:Transcript_47392/g.54579  ORF Transcript_47392/g.54579 Transcript_47392/m.54579 type:complete len:536 (+) Transcript_47392:33-1640(+)